MTTAHGTGQARVSACQKLHRGHASAPSRTHSSVGTNRAGATTGKPRRVVNVGGSLAGAAPVGDAAAAAVAAATGGAAADGVAGGVLAAALAALEGAESRAVPSSESCIVGSVKFSCPATRSGGRGA